MSRKKTNHSARMAATGARRRAHGVAAQMKPAAAQLEPLAQGTRTAAIRRVRKTRAWAAPRVERTGLVLQHSVAPKVSAWLSLAARRLEPAKPQRARWRTLAGISLLTAAAGAAAAAAFARNRKQPDSITPVAETDAVNMAPAAATSDGQAMASTDADVNGQVRAS
jgi:hypothetical protein